ncbi:MAG: hypothetical protein JXA57_01880 [Armatimonadetes bacterium]|nr:hypothetical protein [Armatimonadota bacterium]
MTSPSRIGGSLVVRLPSARDEDLITRFQTYKNYVLGIALFLRDTYGEDPNSRHRALLEEQRQLRGFQRIQGRSMGINDDVRRFLNLSWASETQLALGDWAAEVFVLPYTNAWVPLHSYYAVYGSSQAWFAANGQPPTTDHTSALRTLATMVCERRLLPAPWCVACHGCPSLKKMFFSGLPDGVDTSSRVNVLANPTVEDFWPLLMVLLGTTRDRQIDLRCREWKRREGKTRMPAAAKQRESESLVPTTIFDFLWRMRIRSNYREVESFMSLFVGDSSHADFYAGFRTLVDSTCLLLESLMIRRIGPSLYQTCAEDFLRRSEALGDHPARFLRIRLANLVS